VLEKSHAYLMLTGRVEVIVKVVANVDAHFEETLRYLSSPYIDSLMSLLFLSPTLRLVRIYLVYLVIWVMDLIW